jgi:hypothetical protein
MNLSDTISSIIHRSPYVQEVMAMGLINISSLARYIQEQVEFEMGRPVSSSAILMAIKRLPPSPLLRLDKSLHEFMSQLGDIIVRSDLVDFSFQNTPSLLEKQVKLLQILKQGNKFFYSFCKGVHETTVIVSQVLAEQVIDIFEGEILVVARKELAAVSVMLPTTNLDVYGVYYTILKQLAWQGINVVEVISTSHEITLIVSKQEVDQVFSIFMKMKKL